MSTLTRNQFHECLNRQWQGQILVTRTSGWLAIPIQKSTFVARSNVYTTVHAPWHALYRGLNGWEQYIRRYERKFSLEEALDDITDNHEHQHTNRVMGWENGEWCRYNTPHSTSIPLTEESYIRVYQHTDHIVSWESAWTRKRQRYSGFIVSERHFKSKMRTIEPRQLTFADIRPQQLSLRLDL